MKNGHVAIFSSFRSEMIAWAKIALAKVICFTARLATTARHFLSLSKILRRCYNARGSLFLMEQTISYQIWKESLSNMGISILHNMIDFGILQMLLHLHDGQSARTFS